MIEQDELITFLLCFLPLTFILLNYTRVRSLPGSRVFLFSFSFFTMGWFFTNFEGILFNDLFNLIEHVCCLCSSLLMLIWVIIYFKKRRENEYNRDS